MPSAADMATLVVVALEVTMTITASLAGTVFESRSSPVAVIRYESSIRTPMSLYLATSGRTFSMKAALPGVFGRSSNAASRM